MLCNNFWYGKYRQNQVKRISSFINPRESLVIFDFLASILQLMICSVIADSCNFSVALGQLAKTLQEAKVKIINQSLCSKLYDNLITSRMLCAGNLNGGIDACQVMPKITA